PGRVLPPCGGNVMPTREAVIVASQRTGLAKSFRGSFNLTRPDDMAAHCIKAVLRKVPQLDPGEIEDVVMGCGFPEGPQGFNVGRNVAVMAGLPITVPGCTVNRFCSSGLNAIAIAAHMVQNEGAEAVIGGGLESITMLQNDFNKTNLFNPWLMDHKRAVYMPMGLTAEVVAERYKVTRESQDEYALLSQQRTAAAQKSGKLREEIAPMTVTMEVTDKATGEKSRKEVFASPVVRCRDRLGLDPIQLDANGGSISIGHPYGLTGSRMTGSILLELRRQKKRYGIVTMCVGGGMGAAGLFEAAR